MNITTTTLEFPLYWTVFVPDAAKFREREERHRLARERREAEQKKKLEELLETQRRAQQYREQMEAERRRRLEEVRKKEEEHRLALEERKKRMQIEEQVWMPTLQAFSHHARSWILGLQPSFRSNTCVCTCMYH